MTKFDFWITRAIHLASFHAVSISMISITRLRSTWSNRWKAYAIHLDRSREFCFFYPFVYSAPMQQQCRTVDRSFLFSVDCLRTPTKSLCIRGDIKSILHLWFHKTFSNINCHHKNSNIQTVAISAKRFWRFQYQICPPQALFFLSIWLILLNLLL